MKGIRGRKRGRNERLKRKEGGEEEERNYVYREKER